MPEQLEKIRKAVAERLKGKTNPKTKKPYTTSEINAIAQAQASKSKKEIFRISIPNKFEFKEAEDGEFYASGFIATDHVDKYNDIVPKSTLIKLVDRMNTRQVGENQFYPNYVSNSHDWVSDDGQVNPEMPIAGNAISAQLKELPNGHWGAWAEVHVNKNYPDYEQLVYDIKHQYKPAFSIEYQTLDSHEADGHRVLDDIDPIGFAFAGARMVANPEARIEEWSIKEYKTKEDTKMSEEVKEVPEAVEAPVEEKAEVAEVVKEEVKEEAAEVVKEEAPVENKEVTKALSAEIKSILKKEFKSLQLNQPTVNAGAIKPSISPEIKEYQEAIKSGNQSRMEKATGSFFSTKHQIAKMITFGQGGSSQFEIKEGFGSLPNKIEVKGSGVLEGNTNVQTDTTYLQSAAETADVFDPVLYRQLNDTTALVGILPKVDGSRYGDSYEFRAEYGAVAANSYDESSASAANGLTQGFTDRARYKQRFALYGAYFGITGFVESTAEAEGGIGALWAREASNAAIEVRKDINLDLFTGTSNGMTFGNTEILGLKYLVDDGSTGGYNDLYGVTRTSGNTLNQGTVEAVSSVGISKGQLRKMMRTVEKLGADRGNLVFVCDHVQRDKILGLLDAAQRFNDTSARAGWEGMLHFDGVPVFADKDCDDDYIFLLDIKHTKLVIKQPPNLLPLAVTRDAKNGMVKTYLCLVCTAPNHNYVTTGLKTT